jgi:hypothetical protein
MRFLAASITTILGATVLESPTRPSFAVLLWLVSVPMFVATPTPTPLVWPKSCCCSGANPLADAGGKALTLRMSKASTAHSRFGSAESGHSRW